MGCTYLIRYGLAGRVGRFEAGTALAGLERGRAVVIRSGRGTELGEILVDVADGASSDAGTDAARVLRVAGADDFDRAGRAELQRSGRFEACRRVFAGGVWPLELIDVEPMLDDRRVVLHYLGPHRLDVGGIRAALEAACGIDAIFEPAGLDVDIEEPVASASGGCGADGCGSGGCGSGSGSGGGCSGCAVKEMVAAKRIAPAV